MKTTPTDEPDGGRASLRGRPDFIAFWCATVCASFGFQMMSVAVAWQVYAITGRVLDLGLVGLVQFVPSLLLALPAGHTADRHERRRIVLAAQAFVLLALLVLTALTASHRISEAGIFGILFVIGVAMAFESPAKRSMLPSLVPAAVLPRALAMSSSGSQAATIVGPALGGLLYVAGPETVYAAAASLYLVSLVLMARLRVERRAPAREPPTWTSVFAGIHYIRSKPDLLGVISLDLFAVLLGGATALLPGPRVSASCAAPPRWARY